MRSVFTFLLCCSFSLLQAQLIDCRPRICMINYHYHDDNQPNTDMTTIKAIRPDILIDNTPHGFWGETNGFVGCNPNEYTPLGIEVYSYISGGWEGTHHQGGADTSDLTVNLSRIQGIKNDGATGVFLDEVSGFPGQNAKQYISEIYNKCQQLNLKLILNPGVQSFDPWLVTQCDYVLTDEHYTGTRPPTASELPFLNRVLVVAQNITNAPAAVNITLGARNHGFGFSYACTEYITIPSWIAAYEAQIAQSSATPVITNNGGILSSSADYGNQWYHDVSGRLSGEVNKTFTPSVAGIYYAVVTLDGCESDTSNKIQVTSTSVASPGVNTVLEIYPNPAGNYFLVSIPDMKEQQVYLDIYNQTGQLVKEIGAVGQGQAIMIDDLNSGVYYVVLSDENGVLKTGKVLVSR